MLSKILDTFIDEIKKEENQEHISNFIAPYASNMKIYLSLVVFLLLLNIVISGYISFSISNNFIH